MRTLRLSVAVCVLHGVVSCTGTPSSTDGGDAHVCGSGACLDATAEGSTRDGGMSDGPAPPPDVAPPPNCDTDAGTHVCRDSNGWTVVTPSSDSQIIYVSSSQGNDSNSGTGPSSPVKTLAHGMSLLRFGYPDELLLNTGDSWYEQLGILRSIAGRSATEPLLISSYGTGPRPQILNNASTVGEGLMLGHQTDMFGGYLYIIGIDFYDSAKDPASADYLGLNSDFATNTDYNIAGISWIDSGEDLLIEDCYFHFLAGGIVIQYAGGPSPQDITIRRNVVTDQYATGGKLSQGIFLGGLVGTNVVEENIFDHNAWDPAGAPVSVDPPDVFNHAIYWADSDGATVQNNTFLTDSSLSLQEFVIYGGTPGIPTMTGTTACSTTSSTRARSPSAWRRRIRRCPVTPVGASSIRALRTT